MEAAALLGSFGSAELRTYATSAGADARELAVGALPPRRRAALAVRLSEKRCLEGLVHTNLTLTLAPTRTLSLALTLTVTRCAPRRSRRLAPSAAPRSGTTSCSV